jgi:hypothetical protein
MSEIKHLKKCTMQDYMSWYIGDLIFGGWYDNWQLMNNMDILHVKRITLNNL